MSQFNIHEWNHKRRLAEIEGNLEEATIFDEIDMILRSIYDKFFKKTQK